MEEVLFIETTNKNERLVLHSLKGIEEFTGTLKEIEKKYPDLTRCSRSTLVNLNHVKSFNEQKMILEMEDNRLIIVSIRKKVAIRRLLKERTLLKDRIS
jgi:two-component system response regulator AgrA